MTVCNRDDNASVLGISQLQKGSCHFVLCNQLSLRTTSFHFLVLRGHVAHRKQHDVIQSYMYSILGAPLKTLREFRFVSEI